MSAADLEGAEKRVSAKDSASSGRSKWRRRLLRLGVEAHGIEPVPVERRTDTRANQIFFVWFSWNFNLLAFSTGTLGPSVYGLNLRDSCLVILFFNLLTFTLPAYLTTWGPKLGMRQMVQARYSFGYYGAMLPALLNVLNLLGFSILSCILGGQTLSAVSGGSLSWTVGIVIVAIIALFVSFCGLRFVAWLERLTWAAVLLAFVVALGVGGKHLADPSAPGPTDARAVLSFASVIAGFIVTYAPMASDYTLYLLPSTPSWKLFAYSYAGFAPIIPLQCLGAAAVLSAPLVPAWDAAYGTGGDVGALVLAMLGPVGGFGRFLTVLLALSVAADIAPDVYSAALSLQVLVPGAGALPRPVFALVAFAVILPVAIVGQTRFYDTLNNFLAVIGYWAAAFAAIILVEHFVFRRGTCAAYDPTAWASSRLLPPGAAAVAAGVLSFALVVPGMDQVWFEGPIGKRSGDIGFEVAFVLAGVLYVPLRWVERRWAGR